MERLEIKERPMTPKERGLVIQRRLKERGHEQQYLASCIGITPKKLSEYITGKIKTIPNEVMNEIYVRLDLRERDFKVWELPPLSYDETQSCYLMQMLELIEFVKEHRNEPWLYNDGELGYNDKVRYDLENLFNKFIYYKDLERREQ